MTQTAKPTSLWKRTRRVRCTLTEARGLAFENFLPFCLWAEGIPQPGQDSGTGPFPLKAGYVSGTNEALSQETKNKLASRSLNPQSLPIPYKINTKLLEIHTHVHTTQNPDLLSTTPHGFQNTTGCRQMGPHFIKQFPSLGSPSWPCMLRQPSKPHSSQPQSPFGVPSVL